MYPEPGFNTFSVSQMFKEVKQEPANGRILIAAKTTKYFNMYCETIVGFNFVPDKNIF
jgi:hypothetical protein